LKLNARSSPRLKRENSEPALSTQPAEGKANRPIYPLGRWHIRAILLVSILWPFAVVPVAWRIYRQLIPSGTSFYPYWSFLDPIREGPKLISPDGTLVVRVMFNDAGAAHRGNHWTWLIVDDWLFGKRVVAEGYTRPEVRQGEVAFPSRWLDARTLSVAFATRRYDDRLPLKSVVVQVP
jgi:hypothetical protein